MANFFISSVLFAMTNVVRDDVRYLAWTRAKRNVRDGGFFRARVAEGDIIELNIATHVLRPLHNRRIIDLWLDVQYLVDTSSRGRGAGQHNEHHRKHQ